VLFLQCPMTRAGASFWRCGVAPERHAAATPLRMASAERVAATRHEASPDGELHLIAVS
jgi:hypothetical protein